MLIIKKLIILSIAVVPALAMAENSAVSMYGKITLGFEQIKAEGCNRTPVTNAAGTTFGTACTGTGDVKNRTRVTDSFSYVGFRGIEPLGDGLNAFFQVESMVKADSAGGNQTVGGANSNVWASRNSGIGLRGPFGEILFGRWDVYYTEHIPAGDTDILKGPMAASALAILGVQNGIGGLSFDNLGIAALAAPGQTLNIAQGAGTVDFGGRPNDHLRYQSPNWNGFQFRLNYIAPELRRDYTTTVNGITNSFSAKNDGYGFALVYQRSSLFADYAYYKRHDVGFITAVAANDSTAQKLSLGSALGNFKVGVIAEKLKHESRLDALGLGSAAVVSGGTTNILIRERNAYVLFVSYKFAPWSIGTTYGRAQKVKDLDGSCGALCDKTGANYYQITGLMHLSKSTNLYLTFAKIRNDENASYDFFNQGAVSDTTLISRGANPETMNFGINHIF